MKKAQLISQVFVYIIAGLIFSLVLFFGYRAIYNIGEKQEKVLLYRFIQEFRATVDDLRLRYGSVDIIDFTFPKSFNEFCLVTDKNLVNTLSQLEKNRPGLNSAWETGQYNVFSLPSSDVRIIIKGIEIESINGYCCFDVKGKISLRFEGKGKTVKLSSGDSNIYPCKE